jgi:uncharacterized RDD family membrane protein YckC
MQKVSIQTAQNITINQTPAGVMERIMAFIIDILILYSFIFTVFYLFIKANWLSNISAWSFVLILTLPYFLYFPVIQYYNNGQSFGKKVMKIRVVKTDNTHPRLLDFIIRWLFRTIEVSLFPGVAILFIIITKKNQRLGDIVAGTTVVSEKNKIKFSSSFLDELEEYTPHFKEAALLKEKDIQKINEIYLNVNRKNKYFIYEELGNKIEEMLGIKKPNDISYSQFIAYIIKDYNYFSINQTL